MKITWLDILVMRLFRWRWNPIFADRADMRELWIAWFKAFDVLNQDTDVEVTIRAVRRCPDDCGGEGR